MNQGQSHLPFLAFASDPNDLETLKKFAQSNQWPESCVQQGDIATASEYLKTNPSPTLLLVEVKSAQDAPPQFDALAEVCDPTTKVVVIGSINEFTFYSWLMELGISSYLLKPLSEQVLGSALEKSMERKEAAAAKQERQPGKVIAVLGTRGGVGATTISINLAAIIAELAKKQVALVDIDPQEGSIALNLDLDPSRGFREALEKPDRVDSLFIERVMSKRTKYLSVLSSEESMQDKLMIHEQAAETLVKQMRETYDVSVLDIPRHLRTFSRKCLASADHIVLVAELTLLSLRDTLRLHDYLRESLKMRQPLIVVNRAGLSKYDMKMSDFEKGIHNKVAYTIPFSADVYMQMSEEVPAIKFKNMPSTKPLYQLAEHLVPEAKGLLATVKEKKGFSLLGGKKKAEGDDKEKEKDS